MALKFNYPLEKLNKILQRKLCLSWLSKDKKEERILETIQEIEDLSKKDIFPEEELKCKCSLKLVFLYPKSFDHSGAEVNSPISQLTISKDLPIGF